MKDIKKSTMKPKQYNTTGPKITKVSGSELMKMMAYEDKKKGMKCKQPCCC